MTDRQKPPSFDGEPTRQQVKQEIRRLRSLLREIIQAYVVRREADIAALVSWLDEFRAVESDAKDEQRERQLLEEITKLVGSLKLKPEKGRLKDIRQVHDLVDDLHKLRQQHGG